MQSRSRYRSWSGEMGTFLPTGVPGSTGTNRTMGPNAPDTPLPATPNYRRANFDGCVTAMVIRELVQAMKFDYENTRGRRLWVNLAPHLEPK